MARVQELFAVDFVFNLDHLISNHVAHPVTAGTGCSDGDMSQFLLIHFGDKLLLLQYLRHHLRGLLPLLRQLLHHLIKFGLLPL